MAGQSGWRGGREGGAGAERVGRERGPRGRRRCLRGRCTRRTPARAPRQPPATTTNGQRASVARTASYWLLPPRGAFEADCECEKKANAPPPPRTARSRRTPARRRRPPNGGPLPARLGRPSAAAPRCGAPVAPPCSALGYARALARSAPAPGAGPPCSRPARGRRSAGRAAAPALRRPTCSRRSGGPARGNHRLTVLSLTLLAIRAAHSPWRRPKFRKRPGRARTVTSNTTSAASAPRQSSRAPAVESHS